jgi:eukaryotic-like serine/threonine-protein kinase
VRWRHNLRHGYDDFVMEGARESDPLIGTVLGKDYRVDEQIGVGGMAVVYQVEHLTLAKQFAAKVLSREMSANLEARARFTQEAHAASQLDHENIVGISNFGVTSDGRPYFVMELLRGQTLDQAVAAAPMSLEQVIAVAVPVARALAYAHNEGIVHRDVKPENIFLVQRSQGRFGIKVVDFGIAKTPLNKRLTQMGQTLGSPMFMAPEACRGEEVDHRADVYSFGCLLYLMLCGRVPFSDNSLLKVLQMQVTAPLPPPCEVNPQLSPELGAILERALAKSVDERYLSMDALLHDLELAIPPGADRLLIDHQLGASAAFRSTPFPRSSQPIEVVPATSEPKLPVVLAAPKKSRLPLIIALLSIAFAGAGIAFALLRSSDDGKQVATNDPAPAQPKQTETPAPPPVEDPPPKPPPRAVQLVIETEPSQATVTLDGAELPPTPIKKTMMRDARKVTLVISKPGYVSQEHEIDLGADVTRTFKLEAAPAAIAKKPPRTAKRPPPPPPKPPANAGSAKQPNQPLDIKLSR